jgi:Reverse transcriptase (RNA-dependent DNA polymerase)
MLDQSYTPENFRKIFDYENRKGVYLEEKFFPDVLTFTGQIKDLTVQIRATYRGPQNEETLQTRKAKYTERKALKDQKEAILESYFSNICQGIFSKAFQIKLTKNDQINDKPVYVQDHKADVYFSLKQLQINFSAIYKVKQSDRYFILSQLKLLLGDGFPKYVIRTDIKDFYESISHEKLQKKINEDSLLSLFSKRLIAQILKEYRVKAPSDKGLPRGVGISAYLAELYLRDLDRQIKALPDITYYARYVDDIVVIFTPPQLNANQQYLQSIAAIVQSHDLLLNQAKTNEFDLRLNAQNNVNTFEYLGYKFKFGSNSYKPVPVELHLSGKKMQKYETRIQLAFDHYFHQKKVDEKKARKLLVKRIKFLTSNTRLKNNKKNILTGIYHSHSLLTSTSDMDSLDTYLQARINATPFPPSLSARLQVYSFRRGFMERKFIPFSANDMYQIVKIWKKR